ncbi:hypothetical protein LEP1GSC193_2730 [Leptospira alstonii serovar Pingchang str. 80-412]|uniref:Uncharacterized protein n=2 Tax=Leptospira alstonii TaxID=28452 RepID=M6CUL1_9LEPT|nr:hypothetical protein LEP1GSC194_0129 [Leptospira alstonii serovar Sichuan str. 79601]EQA79177.1 hypothetical protein LEP1GSC193_2730 [Leptospira alstonii serovar Pingchang str. 80-412]
MEETEPLIVHKSHRDPTFKKNKLERTPNGSTVAVENRSPLKVRAAFHSIL